MKDIYENLHYNKHEQQAKLKAFRKVELQLVIGYITSDTADRSWNSGRRGGRKEREVRNIDQNIFPSRWETFREIKEDKPGR